jgi:predicted RNA-binding Zn ribbon-like protein
MVRYSLPLHGGRVCLDFVNSVDPREPFGEDFLPDYASLVAWSKRVHLLAPAMLAEVAAQAAASPRKAARAHGRAIELRELLYAALRALAEGEPPPTARFEQHRQLIWQDGRWEWQMPPVDALDLLVQTVLDDALDLLAGAQRVGRCDGDRCGWLFLDTSKNHSRRWCSMAGCGNRAKSRRHYERRRMR